MKTILYVLLDRFADWEGAFLAPNLKDMGEFEMKTVSLSKEPIRSMGGLTVLPDLTMEEAAKEDFEGVFLIGGQSWRMPEAEAVAPLLEVAKKNNRVIGAICDATTFLAANGYLNDVQHTGNDIADLKTVGQANYTGEDHFILQQAVADQNIITANGTASLDFTRLALVALGALSEEDSQDWYRFNKEGLVEAINNQQETSQ